MPPARLGSARRDTHMTSGPDLREQNLGLAFDVYDTDRDGYLTEDDFPAAGRRILDELAITSPQQRAPLEDAYRALWERLRADCDRDGDGRITRAEFIAAMQSGGGDPQHYYQEVLAPAVDAIARAADKDGDGFIVAADYAAIFTPHGVDARLAGAAFERFDADGDGRISTSEFCDAAAQLMLSQDDTDPGTAMLRP